ncbi:E3 ubiquitin-protein ligase pellino homolog 1-like isoform X2 [Actinia tenebrosa]|nr:E3 ubiquitin-protein ligase pellino homolog 1-like isoform X2 [Actinia tenebrosa]
MLVVLGYNGKNPNARHVRQKSSYTLMKKKTFTGVKPYKQHLASSAAGQQAMQSNKSHSVSYTLERGKSVVVEYCKDENSDMFQIGRSSDSKIDFVVLDTIPGPKQPDAIPDIQKSTISRYACRITVDRNPPHTSRVFAAGFDKTNNIFLGEKAAKWQNAFGMMDGLTTNGILHMNPKGGPNCPAGIWREISVCGNIYGLRETRSSAVRGKPMAMESNVLMDGSLIDLCGAVLMWRTSEGMKAIPTEEMIDGMRQHLNASRPQCPVGLTTLVFPTSSQSTQSLGRQPHVYIKCGHVHGFHDWSGPKNDGIDEKTRTCPICRQASNYVPLQIGNERAFYEGEVVPTHAFVPCGHVCSEATVRFWSQIPIPHGCDAFQAICPFCALPLEGVDGFVKLIFSTEN